MRCSSGERGVSDLDRSSPRVGGGGGGETSPVTMSESDTRSGRRLLNRAAEKRKRGDGGDGSLLISPELRGKGEEKLGVRWRTPPTT